MKAAHPATKYLEEALCLILVKGITVSFGLIAPMPIDLQLWPGAVVMVFVATFVARSLQAVGARSGSLSSLCDHSLPVATAAAVT